MRLSAILPIEVIAMLARASLLRCSPFVSTVFVVLLAGVMVGIAGCGGGVASAPTTPPTTPPVSPPPATTAKPVLKGLVTQGPGAIHVTPTNTFAELNAHPGVYSAAVIQLFWSQLEPSQGVFDDSALVSALASLTAYNTAHPATPVVGKLRIFMGVGTPQWVISATGAVTLSDSFGSATVGEWWTPQFDTYWQALQNHLASEYDTNPMIGEVAITSCSSLTGEPFIVPQNPTDIATLHAAGYTDALQQACISNAPNDYAAWKTTPIDFTFNQIADTDTGNQGINTTFPIQVMDSFRAALGTRGVVANHGLNDPIATGAVPVYDNFVTLYNQAVAANTISPLEFQTYGPTVDWATVIPFAISTYHPTEIEIWDTTAVQGGAAPITQTQLADWAALLK